MTSSIIFAQNCFSNSEIESIYEDYMELRYLRTRMPLVDSALGQCQETKIVLKKKIDLLEKVIDNDTAVINSFKIITANQDKQIKNLEDINKMLTKQKRHNFIKGVLSSSGIFLILLFVL